MRPRRSRPRRRRSPMRRSYLVRGWCPRRRSPMLKLMGSNLVECLGCGATRRVRVDATRRLQPDEGGRCGYVGWAEAESVTEALRRALRETALTDRKAAHFGRGRALAGT